MNLFAMDKGTLLEWFCLRSINHKVVSKQQTWKNGIIGKYCHLKRNDSTQDTVQLRSKVTFARVLNAY